LLGALLIVVGALLPAILLFVVMAHGYQATFGTPGTQSVLGRPMLVSLLLYVLLLAGILVARRLFKIGLALRRPDAIELLAIDRRAPILYLRSFDDDAVPDQTGAVIPFGPQQTIEMRLVEAFAALGPVVSIGRPGERLPELGANRFYVSDDDWQQAVRYFLERAAAVIILVGRSMGVAWEIETALHTVPRQKLLFVFPYLLPKEKRSLGRTLKETIRLRGRGNDSVSKALLADLREEQEARYQSFCDRFGQVVSVELPGRLTGHIFLDFATGGQPRLLPSRQPLFIRRRRDRQGLTLDYRRTLRPFLEKLQNRPIAPDWVERFFGNKFTLGAFTAACMLVALVGFFAPFWYGFSALGVAIFFLTVIPGNLAYWGIWNLSQQISWPDVVAAVVKRLLAAVVGSWLGGALGALAYSAGRWPLVRETQVGVLLAAMLGGAGGFVAGLIAGWHANIWGRILAVTVVGVVVATAGAWALGVPLQAEGELDSGDVVTLALPCLVIGGAIWGAVRAAKA